MMETDMLNAWLWEKHRTDLQWRRVRLGVLPTKELARMYMTILRWIDAIVVSDGIVYLVEAKLRAKPGAISQLKLYRKEFINAPEFTQYRNYPIKLMLLTDVIDLAMVELCSEEDVIYEVFTEEQVNKTRMAQMLPIV